VKQIAIVFATREGHTRDIAAHLAAVLRSHAAVPVLVDPRHPEPGFSLDDCAAVLLAASVHAGHVEREMVRFVREHRAALDRLPHALLIVSLSEAGVERQDATPAEHARFVADVAKLDTQFARDTGWTPRRVEHVAGALAYSRYHWLVRRLMRRIACASGGSTDTSTDHDYTDWQALDRFIEDFLQGVL
jgi:menaquinone-dependent protoporphyrinogen oxidase